MNSIKKPLYCGHAWRGIFINEFGQSYPCCYRVEDDYPKEKKISYKENVIAQRDIFNDVRQSLLDGEFPSMCQLCEKAEKSGRTSRRIQSFEKDYLKNQQTQLTKEAQNTGLLDIHLGDQWNLECRMCTPRASQRLRPVFKKIFNEKFFIDLDWQNDENFWLELNTFIQKSPELERIHFAGGEPFIIKPLWDFLEKLDESFSKKLVLSFNTNLTVLPSNLDKVVSKFKRTHIIVSIEGSKEVHEYIRYPSNRDSLIDNIKKLGELPKVRMKISTVVQILNIFDLPFFLKEMELISLETNIVFVEGRDYLDIKNLPSHLKEKLVTFYEEVIFQLSLANQKNIKDILLYLEQNQADERAWTKFWEVTRAWDRLRNMDIAEMAPELYQDGSAAS